MPYIAIKSFPKDEQTKQKAVEQVNEAIMNAFGCPAEYITISFEDIAPDEWDEKVVSAEIEPNLDHVFIRDGKKLYKGN